MVGRGGMRATMDCGGQGKERMSGRKSWGLWSVALCVVGDKRSQGEGIKNRSGSSENCIVTHKGRDWTKKVGMSERMRAAEEEDST